MMLWPTTAKKAGKWYRGIVKAVNGFKARWHSADVENSWLRHANDDGKKKVEEEKEGGGGERGGEGSHTDTAVDES